MSILKSYTHTYKIRLETTTSDGAGGVTATYTYSASFTGIQSTNSDPKASKQGKVNDYQEYQLLIPKTITVAYGDIIIRDDNKQYMITSNIGDHYTPIGSTLNWNKVTMYEYKEESTNGN